MKASGSSGQVKPAVLAARIIKAGTQWPNRWTSEVFGESWTRLGTNLFGVFSCVGSF